jgi:hypothetical protein
MPSNHTRNAAPVCVLILCAAAALSSCGRQQTAPLSEAAENSPAAAQTKSAELPLNQQTEEKLDPLTQEDVEVYLKVMRAAAQRVKSRLPGDVAALENAKKILAAGSAGRFPNPDEVKTLDRANQVALSMDQIVAEEMKLDARTYRGVVEAVESAVPDPFASIPSPNGGTPVQDHAPTPLEMRLKGVNAANQKFLTPYQEEIESVMRVVRNPANLPK